MMKSMLPGFERIENVAGYLGTLAVFFSNRPVREAQREAMGQGIAVAVLGLLLIGIVSTTMGILLTRRLGRLVTAASRIARNEVGVASGVRGADEIGQLGTVFDEMAEKVEAHSRLQREEATVSGALAKIGRALIAEISNSDFLTKLCRWTAEVLEADSSHLFLFRPEREDYVLAASHNGPDECVVLPLPCELSATQISPLLGALELESVVRPTSPDLPHDPVRVLSRTRARSGAQPFHPLHNPPP